MFLFVLPFLFQQPVPPFTIPFLRVTLILKMQLDVEESTPVSAFTFQFVRKTTKEPSNVWGLTAKPFKCQFWSSDTRQTPVLNFGPVTPDRRTDGQKAMHMSPPCIHTGVLKNGPGSCKMFEIHVITSFFRDWYKKNILLLFSAVRVLFMKPFSR